MKQPLKYSLQQHLNQQRLSAGQLKHLQLMQKQETKPKLNPRGFKQSMVVLVFLMLTSSLFVLNPAYFASKSIEQRIADEVVSNHLKLKPLEVNSDTLAQIKRYFTQLDFLPVTPSFLATSKQLLIGGRYCSIQGVTAVQLRLMDEAGQVQSLYETEFDKNVFKNLSKQANAKEPVTVYANGMMVHIWVEKDILFALTE